MRPRRRCWRPRPPSLKILDIRAAVPSPLGNPAAAGIVHRYELRGEVRAQGALVNRRVRVYRRDTGALVAEDDTAGGKVRLPVGLTPMEFYLISLDLDAGATDHSPPPVSTGCSPSWRTIPQERTAERWLSPILRPTAGRQAAGWILPIGIRPNGRRATTAGLHLCSVAQWEKQGRSVPGGALRGTPRG